MFAMSRSFPENELEDAVQHFRDWLREEKRIDIWMPSIDEINVSISRMDFIKMSGNISKHNYLRAKPSNSG